MPLLSVLWGIALLSLISVSLLSVSSTSQTLAKNALDRVQMEAIAEASILRAALALSDPRADMRWQPNRHPEHFLLNNIQATVRIQDEAGLIDLNFADAGLLFGLFISVGIAPDDTSKIVKSVLEWRTAAGSLSTGPTASDPSGGPTGNYEPRHAPFQSVDELRLVPGITPRIFKLVSSALTVYSQHQSVDSELAPREVLLALPGATAEQVDRILIERTTTNRTNGNAGLPASVKGRSFALIIDVEKQGNKRSYSADIRLVDDLDRLYWVLNWRDQT